MGGCQNYRSTRDGKRSSFACERKGIIGEKKGIEEQDCTHEGAGAMEFK